IDSLNPDSASVGGAGFTLSVRGSGFMADSVIKWNGTSRTTTFVSSSEVTTPISAADIASPGSVKVKVFNPTSNGTSNEKTFTFDYAYSLTATPATVKADSDVTVSWTSPATSTAQDWIGLYRVGDPDTSY